MSGFRFGFDQRDRVEHRFRHPDVEATDLSPRTRDMIIESGMNAGLQDAMDLEEVATSLI